MELWVDSCAIFEPDQPACAKARVPATGPGQPHRGGGTCPRGPAPGGAAQTSVALLIFIFSLVPGTTRPRRLLALWPLPEYQRVIGFSFQLAIIQHQFALHALGYCHLCKDDLPKFRPDLKRGRLEMQLLEYGMDAPWTGRANAKMSKK